MSKITIKYAVITASLMALSACGGGASNTDADSNIVQPEPVSPQPVDPVDPPVVVEPEPVDPPVTLPVPVDPPVGQPDPVDPMPEPVDPQPEPVEPPPVQPVEPIAPPVGQPDPVDPMPEPVDPQPEPVDPQPEPVDPQPEPVDPQPEPVDPQPEPVDPQPEPIISLLSSTGSFSDGNEDFQALETNSVVSYNNEASFVISEASEEIWEVQLTHAVALTEGVEYSVCYDAKAAANRDINVNVDLGRAPWSSLIEGDGVNQSITTQYQSFKQTFTATGTESAARAIFNLGQSEIDVQLDNISVVAGSTCSSSPSEPTDPEPTDPEPTDPEPTDPEPTDPEPTDPEPTDPEPTDPEPTDPEPTDPEPTNSLLSSTGSFTSGAEDFQTSETAVVSYDGEASFSIAEASAQIWELQLTHAVALTQGVRYTVCYDAKADANRTIGLEADLGRDPWSSLMGGGVSQSISTQYQSYSETFTATATEPAARIVFNLGQSDVDVQLDNISIVRGSNCNGDDTDGGNTDPERTLGDTIRTTALDASNSFGYRIAFGSLQSFSGGSYACYNNINMTGVNSIDVQYARLSPYDRPSRLGIYIDDPDVPKFKDNFFDIVNEQYLGERNTVGTGGWGTAGTLNIGFDAVEGVHTLCLVGITGGGVGNLISFTLSDEAGSDEGRMNFTYSPPTVAPEVEKITTEGNQVLFDGVPKSFAGVSLFWGSNFGVGEFFYNEETVRSFKEKWGVNLIRAAIGVEEASGGENGIGVGILNDYFAHKKRAYDVANAAIENGMYVIIDWHSHHAEDHEADAIEFFTDMATKYGEYDNVIYEVYNEPIQSSWSNDVKPYAENVIAAIRAIDPDNLIIVGSPTWSQDVDVAARDPISDANLAYTLHFYAGTHTQYLRDKAQTALDLGVPLFVTEWGMVEASGDGAADLVETDIWMDFLKENNISHAVWAVSDFEGSSIFLPGVSVEGLWDDSDLTDVGEKAKEIIENW